MKLNIKSRLARGILGGIWGLAAAISAYMFDAWLPMFSLLFYPLIFAGAVPLAVLFNGKDVPVLRAVLVGLISGLIYQLLSPIFPLFASVLAGASLGGGLTRNAEKPGEMLGLVLNTIKGSVIVPLVVLTGSFIGGSLYMFTESPLVYWFFWGFWAVIGVTFILNSVFRDQHHDCEIRGHCALDDFKEDARDITRELSELNSNIN